MRVVACVWVAGLFFAISSIASAQVIHLEAEDYHWAGEGDAYHDTDLGNNGGEYRLDDVDIEVAVDVSGDYNVGWTVGGEWLRLTTDPFTWNNSPTFSTTSHYIVRVRAASDPSLPVYRVEAGGATAQFYQPGTGGWQNWSTFQSITTTPIQAGSQDLFLRFDNGGVNVNWVELEPTDRTVAPRIAQRLNPISGHYYELGAAMTWDEARVDAQSIGTFQGVQGNFAVITDRVESAAMGSMGGDPWIALTDSDEASALDGFNAASIGASEGTFVWLDGTPLNYTAWNDGEPNDWPDHSPPGEDAGQVVGNGGWNDNAAGSSLNQVDAIRAYVIEYPTIIDQAKFDVFERRADTGVFGMVDTMQRAVDLLALPDGDAAIAAQAEGEAYAVSFSDPESRGGVDQSNASAPFFSDTENDDDDFVMRATAAADIPTAGTWTFAVLHDDHIRLNVEGSVIESSSPVGAEVLAVNFATAGSADIELIFQERAGGAHVQLYAVEGDWSDFVFQPELYRLVGDVLGGGLALIDATIPGDYDEDGDVDGDDFLTWQAGFGTIYDGDDFLIWQQNFGTSGSASAGVPEPTAFVLAGIIAVLGASGLRRRKA